MSNVHSKFLYYSDTSYNDTTTNFEVLNYNIINPDISNCNYECILLLFNHTNSRISTLPYKIKEYLLQFIEI